MSEGVKDAPMQLFRSIATSKSKTMTSKIVTFLVAAAGAGALILPTAATAQSADEWRFHAIIYGYLPTIGGTTTLPQAGSGSDVSIDADKILKSLKFAFMGTLDANKGRWGVTTDVMYVDLGNGKSGTRDIAIGGTQIPADASANVDLDIKGWIWTIAGTYDALADPQARVQFLAGARLLELKEHLNWQLSGNIGSIPLPGRQGSLEAKLDNWDAIVGVRGRVAFGSERQWFVPYYVDVGAGNSDLTWQAIGGLGYAFKWGDVIVAYRHLDYNMKSGEKIQSVNFNGPAIGVGFHW